MLTIVNNKYDIYIRAHLRIFSCVHEFYKKERVTGGNNTPPEKINSLIL